MAGIDDTIKIFGEIGFKVDATAFELTQKKIDEVESKMKKLRETLVIKKDALSPIRNSMQGVKDDIQRVSREIAQTRINLKDAERRYAKSAGTETGSEGGRDAIEYRAKLKTQQEQLLGFKEAYSGLSNQKFGITEEIQQANNSLSEMGMKLKELGGIQRENALAQKVQSSEGFETERLEIANQLAKDAKISIEQLNNALKKLGWSFNKENKLVNAFGDNVELIGKKSKKSAANMKLLKKSATKFNMALLSIMFTGMAIQRTMSSMMRSLVTTFQTANEDTQGLGKATWHLQAAWEFFKYSLIDALTQSPLFQMLVEWLLKIVNWFNRLPDETKSLIAVGIVILWIVGTVMFLIGQLGMFVQGLEMLGIIGEISLAGLGTLFIWVAAIIAIFIALWMTDLGNFRDFFKNTFGILWLIVKTVFQHIWDVIKDVMALIKAIFKGDFDEVYRIIKNMWKKSLAFQLKIFYALGAAIDNLGRWMINVLVDVAQFGVNALIAAVNALIRALNRVPGVNIPSIPPLDLSQYKMAYTTLEDVKGKFDEINRSIGVDKLLEEIPEVEANVSGGKTKTVVDNRNISSNLTFNMPENVTDIRGIADQVMEEINGDISRLTDSNNT